MYGTDQDVRPTGTHKRPPALSQVRAAVPVRAVPHGSDDARRTPARDTEW
jgi:hypothetical protein